MDCPFGKHHRSVFFFYIFTRKELQQFVLEDGDDAMFGGDDAVKLEITQKQLVMIHSNLEHGMTMLKYACDVFEY